MVPMLAARAHIHVEPCFKVRQELTASRGEVMCLRLQLAETLELEPHRQYLANMLAATVATVASGPFNYARIMQYNTSSERPADKTFQILNELVRETCDNKNNRAFADKCPIFFLLRLLPVALPTTHSAVCH